MEERGEQRGSSRVASLTPSGLWKECLHQHYSGSGRHWVISEAHQVILEHRSSVFVRLDFESGRIRQTLPPSDQFEEARYKEKYFSRVRIDNKG